MPVDEALLLVIPDLADALHLPAAFGDAIVIEDQINHLAGLRFHAGQELASAITQQRRRIPAALGTEGPVAGAVSGGGRQVREMQQLGRPQVHHQTQHKTPEMAELRVRQFAAQGTKEALQERRQARDNHGSALRGSGVRSQNKPPSLGRPFFMRQRRKWRSTAQFE